MLDALVEVPGAGVDDHPPLTKRHHLKDLVRARMARTGESYSTARAHLARRAQTAVRGRPSLIVPVTDVGRATDFYANAFALQRRFASSTWTVLGDGDWALALEPSDVTGVDLGIGVKVVDLPTTLASVVAAGGHVESQSERVARVADPDGNLLRLMAIAAPTP